jgi:exonuclease-1
MGVQQFLGKVLPTAGRDIDLRQYATVYDGRPLRVAVDISTLVYKATQGYGDMLGDERHLDNYGRAELRRQEREAAAVAAAAASANDTTTSNQQPQDLQFNFKVQQYVHKCTQYVMKFFEEFTRSNIQVLVVLDGATPPIKVQQVKKRSARRQGAVATRQAAVDDENVTVEDRIAAFRHAGAGPHFSLVIDAVIAALRSARIPFLVAPYESDGQLAFLSAQRYVDLVITEDSDLIAMGATPILYKVMLSRQKQDEYRDGICGRLLCLEDLASYKDALRLEDFSSAMLAVVFIAAGSDYCEKLKGVGIVTACDTVRESFFPSNKISADESRTPPLQVFFEKLFQRSFDKHEFTDEYKEEYKQRFLNALLMFRHPLVFDPVQGKCVTFRIETPDPELILYEPYASLVRDETARTEVVGAPILPSELACYVAEGWLNPRTMQPRQYARLPDAVDSCSKQYRQKTMPKKKAPSTSM